VGLEEETFGEVAACTDLMLYKLRELTFVLIVGPVNTAVPGKRR
jgi:hypothetical protein